MWQVTFRCSEKRFPLSHLYDASQTCTLLYKVHVFSVCCELNIVRQKVPNVRSRARTLVWLSRCVSLEQTGVERQWTVATASSFGTATVCRGAGGIITIRTQFQT